MESQQQEKEVWAWVGNTREEVKEHKNHRLIKYSDGMRGLCLTLVAGHENEGATTYNTESWDFHQIIEKKARHMTAEEIMAFPYLISKIDKDMIKIINYNKRNKEFYTWNSWLSKEKVIEMYLQPNGEPLEVDEEA